MCLFFKHKAAYDMRISDWSSDVCSSDLGDTYQIPNPDRHYGNLHLQSFEALCVDIARLGMDVRIRNTARDSQLHRFGVFEYVPLQEALGVPALQAIAVPLTAGELPRSEEHTSELQSLMRISYAVFCLKKKNNT